MDEDSSSKYNSGKEWTRGLALSCNPFIRQKLEDYLIKRDLILHFQLLILIVKKGSKYQLCILYVHFQIEQEPGGQK